MKLTPADRQAEATLIEAFLRFADEMKSGRASLGPLQRQGIQAAAERLRRQAEATRKAGQVRSAAKTAAVRQNAQLGGLAKGKRG